MKCPECNGTGEIFAAFVSSGEDEDNLYITCPRCRGTSTIPDSDPELLLARIEALEASLKAAGIPLYERQEAEE